MSGIKVSASSAMTVLMAYRYASPRCQPVSIMMPILMFPRLVLTPILTRGQVPYDVILTQLQEIDGASTSRSRSPTPRSSSSPRTIDPLPINKTTPNIASRDGLPTGEGKIKTQERVTDSRAQVKADSKVRRVVRGATALRHCDPISEAELGSGFLQRLSGALQGGELAVGDRGVDGGVDAGRLSRVGTDMHTSEMPWKSFSMELTGRMRLESRRMASMMSTPDMPMA